MTIYKEPIMTPQENFDRTEDIICPDHGQVLKPGWKCPFCWYPEG